MSIYIYIYIVGCCHKAVQYNLTFQTAFQWLPWWQGSWGQHGAPLGPTGQKWAPCWPHELCYLGWHYINHVCTHKRHPISHLNGHAMGYLLLGFSRKHNVLKLHCTVYLVSGLVSQYVPQLHSSQYPWAYIYSLRCPTVFPVGLREISQVTGTNCI